MMNLKCYRCSAWPCECRDGQCIIWGDCREVLPELEPVDLVLTDPPYNVGIDYGSHNDQMSEKEWQDWARPWFTWCRNNSKTLLITGQARLPYYALIEPWKWLLQWWKPAAMGRSPVGFCEWEPIAMWGNGHAGGLPDVIRAVIHPADKTGHPCPKPYYWAEGQLARFPKAATVLDPFLGSGTTLRACKDLGRRGIGVEIEERYCEIAAERLRQEVLDFS